MGKKNNAHFIEETADILSTKEVLSKIYHQGGTNSPMPSTNVLECITNDLRAVIFPGYFGDPGMKDGMLRYHLGALLDNVYTKLSENIIRGFCFHCIHTSRERTCEQCSEKSHNAARILIEKLPEIRHLLSTDAKAAYEGDPASQSIGETIFCYPSLRALTNYRLAHVLYTLNIPLVPRIITEIAHSETGIDIHPGAKIGEYFFIDHGTGVVIGETTIIGNNVRLYQGVTLGAKSFPLDEKGNPIKGIDRHPVVEDNVIIYSGATVLGRITIGKCSVVGGNVWLTKDVPPNSTIRASFNA